MTTEQLKQKLLELGDKIEFHILEIRKIQQEIANLQKMSMFDIVEQDPEVETLDKKLTKLMKQIW